MKWSVIRKAGKKSKHPTFAGGVLLAASHFPGHLVNNPPVWFVDLAQQAAEGQRFREKRSQHRGAGSRKGRLTCAYFDCVEGGAAGGCGIVLNGQL
jgi:hypothetical protein